MTPFRKLCRFGPPPPFIPDPPGEDDDRFGNAFKNWREWNVAVTFLANLHCGIEENHVYCSPLDPPDILCNGAYLEIKEIMDKGRRRHDEIKARQKLQQTYPKRQDVRYANVIDLYPSDVGRLVTSELEGLSRRKKYAPEMRASLDLLFYVNLLDHWFDDGEMPDPATYEVFGWRSVSAVVATNTSLVFHASPSAPEFIRANAGRIRTRVEPLDA